MSDSDEVTKSHPLLLDRFAVCQGADSKKNVVVRCCDDGRQQTLPLVDLPAWADDKSLRLVVVGNSRSRKAVAALSAHETRDNHFLLSPGALARTDEPADMDIRSAAASASPHQIRGIRWYDKYLFGAPWDDQEGTWRSMQRHPAYQALSFVAVDESAQQALAYWMTLVCEPRWFMEDSEWMSRPAKEAVGLVGDRQHQADMKSLLQQVWWDGTGETWLMQHYTRSLMARTQQLAKTAVRHETAKRWATSHATTAFGAFAMTAWVWATSVDERRTPELPNFPKDADGEVPQRFAEHFARAQKLYPPD